MSGPLRIQYPGTWYHVMNRGRQGEKIFASKEDFTSNYIIIKNPDKTMERLLKRKLPGKTLNVK